MATQLAVSFLYGNFSAVLAEGRQVLARWTPAGEDRSHGWHEGAFRFYLERAIDETGYRGDEVSLAVADVDMDHVHLSVPPVKPRARLQLLENEVSRGADGASVVWSYRYLGSYRVPPRRHGDAENQGLQGTEHYLVHLWPQQKLRQYLEDARAVGLFPRLILPAATLMMQWAERWQEREASIGLVNHTPNGTTMLVRNLRGPEVLIRHLTPGTGGGRSRLIDEVQRSLLYAKQNLGISPRLLYINNEAILQEISATLRAEAEVHLESDWASPTQIAELTAPLSRNLSESLVPLSVRHERRNRIVNRVGNYAVGGLAIASLAIVLAVEWRVRADRIDSDGAAAAYELRLAEEGDLEAEIARLAARDDLLRFAVQDRQPLVAWLLHDLGRMTPREMRIKRLTLGDEQDGVAELSIEAALNATSLEEVEASLQAFGDGLAAEPWFGKLPEGWMASWREQYMQGEIDAAGQELALTIRVTIPW